MILPIALLSGGFLAGRIHAGWRSGRKGGKGGSTVTPEGTPFKGMGTDHETDGGDVDDRIRQAILHDIGAAGGEIVQAPLREAPRRSEVILLPPADELGDLRDWSFDAFAFAEADRSRNGGEALATLGYVLFHEFSLPQKFSIPDKTLVAWLRAMEDGYGDVPFHSALHGADVLQGVFYLITRGGLTSWMTDLEVLALLVAAVVLDFDHPGVSNQFLVNSADQRALVYNDVSVLENHHCAEAFMRTRGAPGLDLMAGMDPAARAAVRGMVIQLVMATDMAEHFNFVALFRARRGMGMDVHGSKEDRMTVLKMVLKAADIAYVARPVPAAVRWIDAIVEEFFRQGDREKDMRLAVSPLCDRNTTDVPKSQGGFVNFIVQPLYAELASFAPGVGGVLLEHLAATRAHLSGAGAAGAAGGSLGWGESQGGATGGGGGTPPLLRA